MPRRPSPKLRPSSKVNIQRINDAKPPEPGALCCVQECWAKMGRSEDFRTEFAPASLGRNDLKASRTLLRLGRRWLFHQHLGDGEDDERDDDEIHRVPEEFAEQYLGAAPRDHEF